MIGLAVNTEKYIKQNISTRDCQWNAISIKYNQYISTVINCSTIIITEVNYLLAYFS